MTTGLASRWSTPLVVLGSILLAAAALAVVSYWSLLDTNTFARHVDEIRQQPGVSDAVGQAIAAEAIAAQPDLLAVRPLLEEGAAVLTRSDLLSPVFREVAGQVQRAATDAEGDAIVLRLADAGAVATSALQQFVPQAAQAIPDNLSVTLAELGSGSLFTRTVTAARWLSIAAWTLPVLALASLAAGVWLAPNHRLALVRAGIGTAAAGVACGALTLATGIAVTLVQDGSLLLTLVDGAWTQLSTGYWIATAALVLAGSMVAAAASALLPEVDVPAMVRATVHRLRARPHGRGLVVLRALAIGAVGLGLLVAPLRLLAFGGVLAGVLVLAYAVTEITTVAVGARAAEAAPLHTRPDGTMGRDEPPRVHWLLAAVTGVVVLALAVGTLALVRGVRTSPAQAAPAPQLDGTCNGHAELCDRPYDTVTQVMTHNAMSAADEPGWFLAEQPHGVLAQLDAGIRALMIDVWEGRPAGRGVASLAGNLREGRDSLAESFPPASIDAAVRLADALVGEPTGPPALYLCHGLCEIGSTPLDATLREVRAWLAANPNEVLTFVVENHVPAAAIGAAFVSAGFEDVLATPPADGDWPTLGEMIRSGRRVLVMTEKGDGGSAYLWLVNAFTVVQDTPYTFPSVADLSCEPNRGPTDAPLLLVNHWLSGFTNLVTAAERVNAREVLERRLADCEQVRGRVPTFVGVNFYDLGAAPEVVDEINGVG